MYKAQIVSPWCDENKQVPQIVTDYGPQSGAANKITTCATVTGRLLEAVQDLLLDLLDPGLIVVEIECETKDALDDIEADSTYRINWSREIVD